MSRNVTSLAEIRTQKLERSLSELLQGYLQNSPEALVFFDWRGVILFQSAHGEALFNRWNRSLGYGQGAESLPAALRPAFQGHDESLRLQHLELPELSAVLDPTPGGFVLRLMDDQTSADLSAQALAALKKLTLSEQRAARLAVEGLRNEQIAQRLCRSPRTIEFQLHCAFRKLGVRNRVQLSRLLS